MECTDSNMRPHQLLSPEVPIVNRLFLIYGYGLNELDELVVGQLKLGDLEVATLEAVWSRGEADAHELHRHFSSSRGISLSTVQSTLERLHRKGLLARSKVSHAYVYFPAKSREAVMARLVDEALGRFRAKNHDGLLAAFAGITASANTETLEALEKMVREARLAKDEPK